MHVHTMILWEINPLINCSLAASLDYVVYCIGLASGDLRIVT